MALILYSKIKSQQNIVSVSGLAIGQKYRECYIFVNSFSCEARIYRPPGASIWYVVMWHCDATIHPFECVCAYRANKETRIEWQQTKATFQK